MEWTSLPPTIVITTSATVPRNCTGIIQPTIFRARSNHRIKPILRPRASERALSPTLKNLEATNIGRLVMAKSFGLCLKITVGLSLAFSCLALCAPVKAQTTASDVAHSAKPAEASAADDYRIGPGDV